jgi:hypothetical protein
MDLLEVGKGMDWIDVAQDRDRRQVLVNAVMNLRIPYGNDFSGGKKGNFSTSCVQLRFSGR